MYIKHYEIEVNDVIVDSLGDEVFYKILKVNTGGNGLGILVEEYKLIDDDLKDIKKSYILTKYDIEQALLSNPINDKYKRN